MGIITLNKVDELWWLGRYTERVFTTLKTFIPYYDPSASACSATRSTSTPT